MHYIFPAASRTEDTEIHLRKCFEFWAFSYCLHLNSVTFFFLSKYLAHLAGSLVLLSQLFCFSVGGSRENFTCWLRLWLFEIHQQHSLRLGFRGALLGDQQAPHILFLCIALGQRVIFLFLLFAFYKEARVEIHWVGFASHYFALQLFSLGCQLLSLNVQLSLINLFRFPCSALVLLVTLVFSCLKVSLSVYKQTFCSYDKYFINSFLVLDLQLQINTCVLPGYHWRIMVINTCLTWYFGKLYLNSTMGQTRLSSVPITYIERSYANSILQIWMDRIIDIFLGKEKIVNLLCDLYKV